MIKNLGVFLVLAVVAGQNLFASNTHDENYDLNVLSSLADYVFATGEAPEILVLADETTDVLSVESNALSAGNKNTLKRTTSESESHSESSEESDSSYESEDEVEFHPCKKKAKSTVTKCKKKAKSTVTKKAKSTKQKIEYVGVTYHPNSGGKKWRARIKIESKTTHIGYFLTEIDAARAYDFALAWVRAYYEKKGIEELKGNGTARIFNFLEDYAQKIQEYQTLTGEFELPDVMSRKILQTAATTFISIYNNNGELPHWFKTPRSLVAASEGPSEFR